jgi:hypothetical protein
VEVRPAALKNEEAQKAREQHANNRAGEALVGYDVTVLHGHQYYAFIRALSTSWVPVPRNTQRTGPPDKEPRNTTWRQRHATGHVVRSVRPSGKTHGCY